MEKYAFQKALLEMMVCNMQLERALEKLNDEKLTFEFENMFNVSEKYLGYSTDIETLFHNAVDTLNEINSALTGAIDELNKPKN